MAPADIMPSPLVSVVVPAYNHERYVEAALKSVYDQDHDAIELIVIDDTSRDRTAAVVAAFCGRPEVQARFTRTVFLQNEKNAGAHVTINRGLQEARGEYINILNSDDKFGPARLSTLLKTCREKGTGFAFSRVELLAEDGVSASADMQFLYGVQESLRAFPTIGFALLRNQCAVSTGNFFFSRDVYERVGGFCDLKYCHDWDFLLRALLVAEPAYVAEPLYIYRLHDGNSFRQLQALAERETDAVLRRYFFLCQNRPVTNPLAPSPAWGSYFSTFIQDARYTPYLAKP